MFLKSRMENLHVSKLHTIWSIMFMYILKFKKMCKYQNQIDYIFIAKDGEALYSQKKQDQGLTVTQIMNSLLPNSELNLRK